MTYNIDILISSHKRCEEIKRVQRMAYRATSRLHKNGLDAASFLLGPFAPLGFAAAEEHMSHDRQGCIDIIDSLFCGEGLGPGEPSRLIAVHLLNTHPGRVNRQAIESWLERTKRR